MLSQSEYQYSQLVNLLLMTLCKRLIKFYSNEQCNENGFKQAIQTTVGNMKQIEFTIPLQIKFSESIKPLENLLFAPKDPFVRKSILKNNFSEASELQLSNNNLKTPTTFSNRKKRVHSVSVTKKKEIQFRQQLLELDEVNLPTNYFIRQSKKF